jgi:single-stranded-DNA-specific exonuclease
MVSRGVEVVGAPEVVGRNHVRFKARQDGRVLDCIGFDLGHLLYRLTPGEANLDMAYVIEENEWRGRKGIQLRIRDLR